MNKPKISAPLQREAQIRAESVNIESRTADFVISSEAVDTYGTVFLSDGWDLSRYLKNPVVTFQHRDWDPDPDLVIGQTTSIRFEDKKMIATVEFEEGNPVAEKVLRKIEKGILRGASIHALPYEARYGDQSLGEDPEVVYFTRHELLAWSVVTLNSNPEAVARTREAITDLIPGQKPDDDQQPKEGMSRFEAQILINQNKVKCYESL